MAERYKDDQKVGGGVLKRAKRRAKRQGKSELLKGGVTGAEARTLAKGYTRNKGKNAGRTERAKSRLEEIGPVGGVNANNGINRREARKVKRAWQTERRLDPNRPRNGRQILSQAQAITDLEYAPAEREYENARRSEAGRAAVMSDWFNQYQAQVAAMAQQQQQAAQAFQTGAYQAAQSGFQASQQGIDQRMQQAQADAATRGATVDPKVAQQAQQAASGNLAQGNAFGTAIGQMGQAQAGLMQQRAVSAGQQRIEVLADSQARSAKIDQLARELAVDKGRALTKNIAAGQDVEHTKTMERKAFGLDVAEAQVDAADKRADNKRQARKDRSARARNKLLNQQTRANIRKTKGEAALDRTADIADDGKRNYSTDYGEYAQRTRPDKDGSGPKGSKDWSDSTRQKYDNAIVQLREKDAKHGYTSADRVQVIDGLVKSGMSRDVARAAWIRFMRKKRKAKPPKNRAERGLPIRHN